MRIQYPSLGLPGTDDLKDLQVPIAPHVHDPLSNTSVKLLHTRQESSGSSLYLSQLFVEAHCTEISDNRSSAGARPLERPR